MTAEFARVGIEQNLCLRHRSSRVQELLLDDLLPSARSIELSMVDCLPEDTARWNVKYKGPFIVSPLPRIASLGLTIFVLLAAPGLRVEFSCQQHGVAEVLVFLR